MSKTLKVPQTLNIFKNFQNCGISRHKFLCSTKTERLKLYEPKFYSKTFQSIIKLMNNRTYFEFKNSIHLNEKRYVPKPFHFKVQRTHSFNVEVNSETII